MRIYVLNFRKHRLLFGILSITVIAAGLFLLCFGLNGGFNTYAVPAAGEESEKVIIIDAGHGGVDVGAKGTSGVFEKDLNLEIALELGRQLSDAGYVVIYTRTDDRLLYKADEDIKGLRKISDLKNRCAIAEEHPEALFISVHMNSFGESKYSGTQVYYSENSEDSKTLASDIQSAVKKAIQPENKRTTKSGNEIYILKNIKSPAVLIECGFITNAEECARLSEKEYQKQLCSSIVCGIIEYMNTKTAQSNG